MNPSLEQSQAIIETLREVVKEQADLDNQVPMEVKKHVFNIVSFRPQNKNDTESQHLKPDTPTR